MTLLPFIALAFGAGVLGLLTRRTSRAAAAIGIVGLLLAALAAATIGPEEPIAVAGTSVAGTAFARTFLVLGSAVGAVLALIGLATAWPRSLAPATLLALGGAAIALGSADPLVALLAAAAGGFAGLLLMADSRTTRAVATAADHLRTLGVAAAVALAAAAWIARPIESFAAEPFAFGIALLAIAAAVAIRFGAVPFHLPAVGLPESAPVAGLPLLLAWSPAAFAVAAFAWADGTVGMLGLDLPIERALIVLVGGVTVVVATAAAYLHDDLEHVIAYATIADAGIVVLAFGALDPAAWEPTRLWLLAFVMSKSALAAWAVAVVGAFGTGQVRDLDGWARRAPLLGIGLVVIAIASIGWPGLASFDARWTLVRLAIGGPLGALLMVGGLASVGIYARIVLAGLRRRSPIVAGAATGRLVLPPVAGRSAARMAPVAWRLNRGPIAAVLVVGLALASLAVGAGGLGARAAAAALPPRPAATLAPSASPEPDPTPTPTARPTPSPRSTRSPAASASALASGPVGPSGSPAIPLPSFRPVATPSP